MSLLEGHGDITMDRAGVDRIPNAAWFSRVLKERRRQRGMAKLMSALIGLDAKLQPVRAGRTLHRGSRGSRGSGPAGQGLGRTGVAAQLARDPHALRVDLPGGRRATGPAPLALG